MTNKQMLDLYEVLNQIRNKEFDSGEFSYAIAKNRNLIQRILNKKPPY